MEKIENIELRLLFSDRRSSEIEREMRGEESQLVRDMIHDCRKRTML